jgi:hypothetical protein
MKFPKHQKFMQNQIITEYESILLLEKDIINNQEYFQLHLNKILAMDYN